MHLSAASISLFAAGGIGLAATFFSYRRQKKMRWDFLTLMILSGAALCIAEGVGTAAVHENTKLIWHKLVHVSTSLFCLNYLLFALHYSQNERWNSHLHKIFLAMPIAINIAITLFGHNHGLIFDPVPPELLGFDQMIEAHGPWFPVEMAIDSVYMLLASLLLVIRMQHAPKISHREVGFLIMVVFLPFIAVFVSILSGTPNPNQNTIPFSFGLSSLLMIVGLTRYRIFSLTPIARNAVMEEIEDGIVIADINNSIVDINLNGQRFLNLSTDCIGTSLSQALGRLKPLTTEQNLSLPPGSRVMLDNTGEHWVELRISQINDRAGKPLGNMVSLRDVTHTYRKQEKLKIDKLSLEHKLDEIESLRIQLEDLAMRDPLTGLYNRRYMEDALKREISRALRSGHTMAVVMIDIDHFKHINDSFGHNEGDRILVTLSGLLKSQIRYGDLVCRYGGEEFLIAMPGVALELAQGRIEALRIAFENVTAKTLKHTFCCSLSAGIAVFPHHGDTEQLLIKAADEALYQAKREGRNCVRVASPVQKNAIYVPSL